ncbi:TolC family outer membrane protein [Salinisphaera sp. G21_0]|uniref:TolC family outer membrane protein n=1 Tax=Salinisphaera sp. G21_0 TaxID=2821094 RepID=UPI001ADC07B9|nr:TolC family outer membrane protein [Salinisphaera sp. G21_0]MBO9481163.1 TolC family outer membrane protein [Salinisphaera sp. G21_0]
MPEPHGSRYVKDHPRNIFNTVMSMKRLAGIHHLRCWLSVLLVAANIPSANAQSLAEAVSTALMTSPELHLAMQKVQTRVDEESIAKSGFLPTLNVQGGSGYEWSSNQTTRAGGPDSDDRLHRYESSITFRQVLFAGFSTIHDSNRSEASTRSAQYRLITTASEMALKVTQTYLTLIMMERALAMSEQNLKVHQDIYYNIFKRSESGVQSIADLSLVSGRLARAQSNTIAAENNLQDARFQFVRLVGAPACFLLEPVPDMDLLPETMEQAVLLAGKNYPLLKSALQDNNAAESEYLASKGRFYPEISFEATRSWNYNMNGLIGRDDDYNLMFHARYNLFNGGADSGRMKASLSRWNEAKDIYHQALLDTQEEARLAWEAHAQLNRQLPQLQKHVTYSLDTVSAYRRQFAFGERALLDVLNAENESLEAELAWNRAWAAQLVACYRLLHITGRLLESLGLTLPPDSAPEASITAKHSRRKTFLSMGPTTQTFHYPIVIQ